MCKIWCANRDKAAIEPGKQECVKFLKSHYRWYQGQYRKLLIWYGILTFTTIGSSAVTSILLALKLDENDSYIKNCVIILPIISTIVSSLLAQLKLRDTANLRELGRIEMSDLINEAIALPDGGDDVRAACLALKRAAVQIERDQARRFFAAQTRRNEDPN